MLFYVGDDYIHLRRRFEGQLFAVWGGSIEAPLFPRSALCNK